MKFGYTGNSIRVNIIKQIIQLQGIKLIINRVLSVMWGFVVVSFSLFGHEYCCRVKYSEQVCCCFLKMKLKYSGKKQVYKNISILQIGGTFQKQDIGIDDNIP